MVAHGSDGCPFSVVLAGIGGQGIMLISRALANAAAQSFEFVCRTEDRGLSQRGGAVSSCIRFGPDKLAPVIGNEQADLILSLDLLEAARYLPLLKSEGRVVSNSKLLPPLHLLRHWEAQASRISSFSRFANQTADGLRATMRAVILDLSAAVTQSGSSARINCALLGAASHLLPIATGILEESLGELLKPEARSDNLKAFELGRKAVSDEAVVGVS